MLLQVPLVSLYLSLRFSLVFLLFPQLPPLLPLPPFPSFHSLPPFSSFSPLLSLLSLPFFPFFPFFASFANFSLLYLLYLSCLYSLHCLLSLLYLFSLLSHLSFLPSLSPPTFPSCLPYPSAILIIILIKIYARNCAHSTFCNVATTRQQFRVLCHRRGISESSLGVWGRLPHCLPVGVGVDAGGRSLIKPTANSRELGTNCLFYTLVKLTVSLVI